MNENKANYAKIGFFVLSGFALILVVIGIAGARVFRKQVVLAETYFTESVTGLDIGSPVKYRGVPVGEVSRIGFLATEYGFASANGITPEQASQILVVLALDPERFTPLKQNHGGAFLEKLVAEGLRVKLTASGVTGLSYLELDFFPAEAPEAGAKPLAWTPKSTHIPSTPSTMFAFKKAIDDVFLKLNAVNIQALGDELLATLYLVQSKLVNVDLAGLTGEAQALLAELRASNRSLQELLAAPELKRLPADLAATAARARSIADKVDAQLDPLLGSARSVSERADRLVASLSATATNAAAQVEQTASSLSQTAQTLNRTALSQQDAVAELLRNLRSASTSLDRLVHDLRATPSALLFSQPPAPLPEIGGQGGTGAVGSSSRQ